MKPRTLLILLVVVAGLGAFIWFYERKLPSSEERAEQSKKVLSLKKEDVTAVTLGSPAGEVRLERVAEPEEGKDETDGKEEEENGEETPAPGPSAEWRITKPLTFRADTFAVDRLLDSLLSLEKTRTVEDANPKDLGLDKPRATVRLATKDGETVLKLGAEVPTGAAIIAGLEGAGLEGEVYVVSDTILAEIQKPPGDWREHAIFHGDREEIQRITLAGSGAPGGPVVLARRPQGFWIEKPFSDRADRELVDGLLSDIAVLTAEQFLDGRSPADLGLTPPRAVVEVAFKPGKPPVRIELGAPAPGAPEPAATTEHAGAESGETSYGRVGTTLFEARTPLAETARRAPADWRARQLSAFEVFQVDSATVRDGKTSLQLTRAGTDWKRGDTTISYVPVSDLFFAVTGARADRLLTSQEARAMRAGLAKPVLTFELQTKDAGKETLTLYPPLPEGVPARASGRQTVLLLPTDTLKQIQEKLQAVRTAKQVTSSEKGEE